MNWQLKSFSELTLDQLYELLKLRTDIFVVEQQCPYPEIDGKDREADVYHLLGYQENRLVACLRLLPPALSDENYAAIGRVAIDPSARGNGTGHMLLTQGIQQCTTLWPAHAIRIGAQTRLQTFYERHGFVACSDPYLEDDIPHIDMIRKQP